MDFSDYINIAAIILAPIVSVIVGQKLQDRARKRDDKMQIFKILMASRIYGWTNASVEALNLIEVVFAKDKKVIANITVNQKHFEQKQELIKRLVDEKLIYGLGISLVNPSDRFISLVKQYPNAVIHVINGICFSIFTGNADNKNRKWYHNNKQD